MLMVPFMTMLLSARAVPAPYVLKTAVATSLATYKHLRHVVVVDTIPRLPSGKVLRRTLRDTWTPVLVAGVDG
jgi:acyl-coenzyme A synthetase/AMP-(fatty) acid ligase